MRVRVLLLLLAISCFLPACNRKNEKGPETSIPLIKLAQRDWLSFKLTNMVAKILLEEEMGYRVALVDVDGETQFESLTRGETHTILEVWPSSWQNELKKYLQDNALIEHGGELGVVGKAGWFIPSYVSALYPELRSWEGFKSPELARHFNTPETGKKGRLLEGDPDWKYHDADIIRNLDLPLQIVMSGSEERLIELIEAAYQARKPVLFHFWTPHYLFAKLDLDQVQLPPATEECYAEKKHGGFACDYETEVLIKLLWPGLEDQASEVAQFIKNVTLTNEDQISMLGLVEIDGKNVEEAARLWLKENRQTWEIWLP